MQEITWYMPEGQRGLERGVVFDTVPVMQQTSGTQDLARLEHQINDAVIGSSGLGITPTILNKERSFSLGMPQNTAAILLKSNYCEMVEPREALAGHQGDLLRDMMRRMAESHEFDIPLHEMRLIFEALWPTVEKQKIEYWDKSNYWSMVAVAHTQTNKAAVWGLRIPYHPSVTDNSDAADLYIPSMPQLFKLGYKAEELDTTQSHSTPWYVDLVQPRVLALITSNNLDNPVSGLEEIALAQPNERALQAKIWALNHKIGGNEVYDIPTSAVYLADNSYGG
jgi:hypothetical protein